MNELRPKKIWIDLDNSPHVPFFLPIVEELDKAGYKVFLTARDSYQVCELLSFYGLSNRAQVVGRHYGKNRLMKIAGTCFRAVQLLPLMLREKPDLVVSHGARAQMLSAFVKGIPSVVLFDYEFVSSIWRLHPHWIFAPALIPKSAMIQARNGVMRYPGLKEDVYAPQFRPDPSIKEQLGLTQADIVVTVRPPATEAHYHNPEAEVLLDAVMESLLHYPDVRVILVPRNKQQEHTLRNQWKRWIAKRTIIIPEHVMNGLNLIWFSDLVVSGGGTMNREAAALGVPVYSIFRGRIGAVDQYLARKGRLTLIENVEEVRRKITVKRRAADEWNTRKQSPALDCIVNAIISIAEHQCLPAHHEFTS